MDLQTTSEINGSLRTEINKKMKRKGPNENKTKLGVIFNLAKNCILLDFCNCSWFSLSKRKKFLQVRIRYAPSLTVSCLFITHLKCTTNRMLIKLCTLLNR